MSDELCLIEIPALIPKNHYDRLLGFLDSGQEERIKKTKLASSKNETILANYWARYFIGKKLGISLSELIIEYGKYGKPEVVNSDIYFNISHSGSWIAITISDSVVGVDIEACGLNEVRNLVGNFSEEEITSLENISEEEKELAVLNIWTVKESYLKAMGKGLAVPLSSFDAKDLISDSKMYIEMIEGLSGYVGAICKLGSSGEFQKTMINKEEALAIF